MALAGHPRPQLVSTLSALCLNCPTNMRVRTILSAVVIADTIYYAMISVLAIILWFSKNHPLGFRRGMKLSVVELYLEKTRHTRAANGPRPLHSLVRSALWVVDRPFIAFDGLVSIFDGPVSIFAMFVLMCIIFERKVSYQIISSVCKVLRSNIWKIIST